MLFLAIIPATLYGYLELEKRYYRFQWYKHMPHSQIVWTAIGIGLAMVFLLLTIRSFSFINARKARSFRFCFKQELFDCVKTEIPEICDYRYNQKIHPSIFYKSGLFKSKYSDYTGDDWIIGQTNNALFDMCELHVFNLFKDIFSGIFIRIRMNTAPDYLTGNLKLTEEIILAFEEKYNGKVLTSQIGKEMYIAIKLKGKFFESINPRAIEMSNTNVQMLKDIVGLVKRITDNKLG